MKSPYENTPQDMLQQRHCGAGWTEKLVTPFLEALAAANDPTIRVAQIKEKFGTLRIYQAGPEWVDKLATAVEQASELCCEECGTWNGGWNEQEHRHVAVQTNALPRGFWIKTLCDACRDKRQREYDEEQANRSLKTQEGT